MSDYFSGCSTLAEAKTRYRQLMRRYHPDTFDPTAITQEINAEYEHLKGDARPDGTLPEKYAGQGQAMPQIVYRDRIVHVEVPVEKVVYRDRVVEKIVEVPVYYERVVFRDSGKVVYHDPRVPQPQRTEPQPRPKAPPEQSEWDNGWRRAYMRETTDDLSNYGIYDA